MYVHKIRILSLGFYEALLGLLNPVVNLLGRIIYDDSLFFVNNTVLCFHTSQTMRLPLACLSSLTISKNFHHPYI